jgi:hypothetical protein
LVQVVGVVIGEMPPKASGKAAKRLARPRRISRKVIKRRNASGRRVTQFISIRC